MLQNVILVDRNNNQIWVCEKMKAHIDGKLHRAFSIFIFNSDNELLLQQRAETKYHSGGLWTNTVCSHPKPDEDISLNAKQRLHEELWFTTDIKELFSFYYKSDYVNWLTEHEYDHVFVWHYDNNPIPNKEEVMDYKWITIEDLLIDVKKNPNNYTSWFRIILEDKEFLSKISNYISNNN